MNNAQRLAELAQKLPEPLLNEVLDFAEFLQRKHVPAATDVQQNSFAGYFGALSQTPLFDGQDPIAAQQVLRDEWN